jgi:hypothetical protein
MEIINSDLGRKVCHYHPFFRCFDSAVGAAVAIDIPAVPGITATGVFLVANIVISKQKGQEVGVTIPVHVGGSEVNDKLVEDAINTIESRVKDLIDKLCTSHHLFSSCFQLTFLHCHS